MKSRLLKFIFFALIFSIVNFLNFSGIAFPNIKKSEEGARILAFELNKVASYINEYFINEVDTNKLLRDATSSLVEEDKKKDLKFDLEKAKDDKEFYNEFEDLLNQYAKRNISIETKFEEFMKIFFKELNETYTVYYTEKEMQGLMETLNGDYAGIGIAFTRKYKDEGGEIKNSYIRVEEVFENSSAYKAGILVGDYISKVDGTEIKTLSDNEIINRIRGREGEMVKITVLKGEKEVSYSIPRKIYKSKTLQTQMTDGILYISLSGFNPNSPKEFLQALQENSDYKGIILDLRYNPGGLLPSCLSIADLFLDGGLVVGTKGKSKMETREYNANKGVLIKNDIPVVVLINGGSASASEILSGALKDKKRAYIIGENSYGKGRVQSVGYVANGLYGMYRFTVSEYYTPSGTFIDKIGIIPNLTIEYEKFDKTKNNLEEYEKFASIYMDDFLNKEDYKDDVKVQNFINDMTSKTKVDRFFIERNVMAAIRKRKQDKSLDLKYDLELKEAVNIIKSGNWQKRVDSAENIKKSYKDYL